MKVSELKHPKSGSYKHQHKEHKFSRPLNRVPLQVFFEMSGRPGLSPAEFRWVVVVNDQKGFGSGAADVEFVVRAVAVNPLRKTCFNKKVVFIIFLSL